MADDRLRIALVTPEYPGCGPAFGIGRYMADLAGCLAEAGHEIEVIAATDTGCYLPLSRGIERVAGPTGGLVVRPWTARRWLRAEVRSFSPHVVEAPNWGGLGLAVAFRRPLVVRLSTSIADAGGVRSDRLRPFRMWVERRSVRKAGLVVADSGAMAARGEQLYDRRCDAVVPHAWTGPCREPTVRMEPAVLFVGRWEPRKGVDVLLAAWPWIRCRHPEARLHLVGRGRPDAELPAGATFHGELDEDRLDALRNACRIQVVPSRFESFGMVVLEAWAHGLGVVGTTAGGLREVIGEAGVTVPPGDAGALANAISAALPQERALALARAGHARLAEHFSPRPWVERTIAAYHAAIKRDRSAR